MPHNLVVCTCTDSSKSMHTLLTANSPGWLGTDVTQQEINFTYYPNPTSKSIFISSKEAIDQIEIVDLFGRSLILVSGIDALEFEMDLSNYSNATYLLKVSSATTTEFYPLVKN